MTSPLPLPHPLDYEWRFNPATRNKVAKLLSVDPHKGRTVALLGTPSLLFPLLETGAFKSIHLLDSNRSVVNSLNAMLPRRSSTTIHVANICSGPLPRLFTDTIFMDPPWYVEHFKSFFWSAARLSRPSTKLFVCFPPPYTRPSIKDEVKEIVSWAHSLGFELIQVKSDALRFETPFFEVNAFRAGKTSLRPNWRTGDLMVFRMKEPIHRLRPPAPQVEFPKHREVSISGTRIRFEVQGEIFGDPRLISVVPGDILPTVSRRDRRRKLARVWTSGNRIFACASPMTFGIIASALARQENPIAAVRRRARLPLKSQQVQQILNTVQSIVDLVLIEQREASHYAH